MSQTEFKKTVTSDAFWLSTAYIVLFLLVARVLDVLLFGLTLIQWLFRLLTGENNEFLIRFCASMGIYYQQVTHYLTGCSEDKPFPFREWPEHRNLHAGFASIPDEEKKE